LPGPSGPGQITWRQHYGMGVEGHAMTNPWESLARTTPGASLSLRGTIHTTRYYQKSRPPNQPTHNTDVLQPNRNPCNTHPNQTRKQEQCRTPAAMGKTGQEATPLPDVARSSPAPCITRSKDDLKGPSSIRQNGWENNRKYQRQERPHPPDHKRPEQDTGYRINLHAQHPSQDDLGLHPGPSTSAPGRLRTPGLRTKHPGPGSGLPGDGARGHRETGGTLRGVARLRQTFAEVRPPAPAP
jgi:hypothetical protein